MCSQVSLQAERAVCVAWSSGSMARPCPFGLTGVGGLVGCGFGVLRVQNSPR